MPHAQRSYLNCPIINTTDNLTHKIHFSADNWVVKNQRPTLGTFILPQWAFLSFFFMKKPMLCVWSTTVSLHDICIYVIKFDVQFVAVVLGTPFSYQWPDTLKEPLPAWHVYSCPLILSMTIRAIFSLRLDIDLWTIMSLDIKEKCYFSNVYVMYFMRDELFS